MKTLLIATVLTALSFSASAADFADSTELNGAFGVPVEEKIEYVPTYAPGGIMVFDFADSTELDGAFDVPVEAPVVLAYDFADSTELNGAFSVPVETS